MTKEKQKLRQRLADILDCEGSLGIYHWPQLSSTGKINNCWIFTMTVSQKQEERLLPLQNIFGGKIAFNSHSYRIVWSGRKTVKLVRYLLPDIEWKKEQAKKFLRAYTEWPKWDGRGRGNEVPLSIMVERANLANSVNALNEGGRTRVVYRVIPSQIPDTVDEVYEGNGVTVIHEKLNP